MLLRVDEFVICYTVPIQFKSYYTGSTFGVATIVQGTVVQGISCPRTLLSKGQLSEQTLVQGDFCPRCELTNIRLFTLFFFDIL